MKHLYQRIRAWYRRRFRGFVAAPRASGGTNWQQHDVSAYACSCECGQVIQFTERDLFVRARQHRTNCTAMAESHSFQDCDCPISEGRYCVICSQCRLGHWKLYRPPVVKFKASGA